MHGDADEPDEIIVPAVQGTLNILASAKKHGADVRRVVLTSSCTAVAEPGTEGATVDERDWNERSIREVRTKGRAAHAIDKYRASKTLSERAAWAWYEGETRNREGGLGWDMVVLNPSFVLGPWLHKTEGVGGLSLSLQHYYSIVLKGQMSNELLAETGCGARYHLAGMFY